MPPKVNEYQQFTTSSTQTVVRGSLSKAKSAQVENMVKQFTSPSTAALAYTGIDHFVSKEHSNLFISKQEHRATPSSGQYSSVHARLTNKLTKVYYKTTLNPANGLAILEVVNVLAAYQLYLWKDLLPNDTALKPSDVLFVLHEELTPAQQNGPELSAGEQVELRGFEEYTSILKDASPDGKVDARTAAELHKLAVKFNIIKSSEQSPSAINDYNTSLANKLDLKAGLDDSNSPADPYEKAQLRTDMLASAAPNPYDDVDAPLAIIDAMSSSDKASLIDAADSERSSTAKFDDDDLDDIL